MDKPKTRKIETNNRETASQCLNCPFTSRTFGRITINMTIKKSNLANFVNVKEIFIITILLQGIRKAR